jgi:hypothetical protein
MALSEDQKAMLRLLAQRGEQGYEDLAALMGIDVGEVHAKALEAAAQLESEGIPAPAIPPPPGASTNPPQAPANPEAAAQETPPEPEPVEKPAPRPAEQKPAPTSSEQITQRKRTPPPRPNVSLPGGGGARAAIAAGVLVVIALVLVLALSGGEDSGDTSADGGDGGGASEQALNTANGDSKEVTQAILEPVGGGGARGVATFGRVKNSLALQLETSGLDPTGSGESYTVWLYESPRKMLPLASTRVGKSGEIGVQVEVPTEVLGYLASESFDQINLSLTDDAALKASLAKATIEKKAPIYTGTDVLRGRITGPIIGAAKK